MQPMLKWMPKDLWFFYLMGSVRLSSNFLVEQEGRHLANMTVFGGK